MTIEAMLKRAEAHPLRAVVAALAPHFPQGAPASVTARHLAPAEIAALRAQGCHAEDWGGVRVVDGCSLARIRNVEFEGPCLLGHGDPGAAPPVMDRCRLQASWVGRGTVLRDVALLDRAVVEGPGTEVLGATYIGHRGTPSFGLGEPIVIAPGGGRRRVPALPGMFSSDLAAMCLLSPISSQRAMAISRCRDIVTSWHSDFAFVGAGSSIIGAGVLEDVAVIHAVLRMVPLLRRSVLAGEAGHPVLLEAPGSVDRVVAGPDAAIASGGICDHVFLAEASWVRDGARASSSIIAPNSGVGSGELRYSFLGSFVGFSHEALCIATFWPRGRGNISYGANVGSNHTGRAADQEYHAGEGVFHGLDCAIKFPADTLESPYTLIASGAVCLPQRVAFPFSLINNPGHGARGLSPAFNELLPGWQLSSNLYGLLRSEQKFAARNRARHEPVTTAVFREEWRPLLEDAIGRIEAALGREPEGTLDSGEGFHTERTLAGAGKNYVRRGALEEGLTAYRWGLELLAWFGARARGKRGDPRTAARILLRIEEDRARDDKRGIRIILDYAAIHGTADDDDLIAHWRRVARGD